MKKAVWLLLIVFGTQYGIINPDLDWVAMAESDNSDNSEHGDLEDEGWVVVKKKKPKEKPERLSRVGFSPTASREEVELPKIFSSENEDNTQSGIQGEEQEPLTTSQECKQSIIDMNLRIQEEQAANLAVLKKRRNANRKQYGVQEIIIQCLNVDIFETLRKRKAIPDEKRTGCTGLEWNNPQELLHKFDCFKKTFAVRELCYYRTQYVRAESGGPYYEIYKVTDDIDEVAHIQAMDRYFPLFMTVKLEKKKPFDELKTAVKTIKGLEPHNIVLRSYEERVNVENRRLAQEYQATPVNESMNVSGPQSRSGSYHRIPTETVERRRSLSDIFKSWFGCVIA